MRRMILRMIANGSLSAFSAAAFDGLPSQGGVRPPAHPPIQQVRQTQGQVQPQPQIALPDPGRGTQPQTSRILPRGSLLNLSV